MSHGHSHEHVDADNVAGELIRLPGSPFWNVFKRFGRDEALALFISIAGTMIISFFTTSAIILAFIGPVIEKIGFFPAHIYEALTLYRATPRKERKPFSHYFFAAMKGGSVSLIEDIVIHDPIYVILFLGLSRYPGIPVWLAVSSSFLIAVVIVAWLEVGVTEVRYALLKRKMLRMGFGVDSYREARFFIRSENQTLAIIEKLQRGFDLSVVERLEYHDTYFTNDMPTFSGRAPVVRLRHRTLGTKDPDRLKQFPNMVASGEMQTVQVIYHRAQEENTGKLEQFRFYPTRKDKFYWFIDEKNMPDSIEKIPNKDVRDLLRAGGEQKHVSFKRTVMLDKTKTLYAAVDSSLNGNDEGCIIELKIRENPALFLAAMRFVMMEFPVTHTTRTKPELAIFR